MGFISGNAYLDLSLLVITLSLFLIVTIIFIGCLAVEVHTFRRKRHTTEDYRMLFNSEWSKKP